MIRRVVAVELPVGRGKKMADWEQETRADYERKGFAVSSGFGKKPGLLVVDFIVGFTDPSTPLGGDFSSQLAVTSQLQPFRFASGMLLKPQKYWHLRGLKLRL